MIRALSKIFIIFGTTLIIVSGYLYYLRVQPSRLVIQSYAPSALPTPEIHEIARLASPTSIEIPKIQIYLPLIPSKIENGKWETTTAGVSYLVSSPIPGQLGNSILYGHNWTSILGKLPQVRPGDEIIIRYDNQTSKTFVIDTTAVISPTQIGILDQTDDRRITIYTCTGFLDTKRFVAVALLKN